MEQEQIFWLIAIVSTGIFVVQFILSIFFGDVDVDVDGDAEVDSDVSSVMSFKGLVHFGIGFGWRMVLAGEATLGNLVRATLVGLIFVFSLWRLYILAYRLQTNHKPESSKDIVGRYGKVYANHSDGRYVIQISYNGAMRELDVISLSGRTDYRTGERVTVEKFDANKYYIA